MKRNTVAAPRGANNGSEGAGNTAAAQLDPERAELAVILESLRTMRDGNFSVRLPGSWTGLAGKVAETPAE